MAPRTKKRPKPADLLAEVRGIKPAKTYEFDDYVEVIDELKNKDYSYADVASFLAEKLGIAVTRGQVYRAHSLWMEAKEEAAKAEAEEARIRSLMPDEDSDLPSEPDPAAEETGRLTGKLLMILRNDFPEERMPCSHVELLKNALSFLDNSARDELSAERADEALEKAKKNAAGTK